MVSRATLIADGLRFLGLSAFDPEGVERLVALEQYLAKGATSRGFLGERDRGRILSRHLLESAALLRWLPEAGPIVDVGSGAGLPGLVVACLHPGPLILIESQARKAAFLREVAYEVGATVEVVHARAEREGHSRRREAATAATARALAPVPVALELTMPFIGVDGIVALLVGPQDDEGVASAAAAADALGGAPPSIDRFEVPGAKDARWVMIVRKLRTTPDRFPRPPGPRRRRPAGADVM